MALTNEDLLAISQLLDTKLEAKLEPLKVDIREIKNDVLSIKRDIENTIKPDIKLLAENYVPAARKYEKAVPQIACIQADVELLKKLLQNTAKNYKRSHNYTAIASFFRMVLLMFQKDRLYWSWTFCRCFPSSS